MADEHGVGAVVKHLGLDHAKLKAKLEQKRSAEISVTGSRKRLPVAPSQDLPPTFLELLAPEQPGARNSSTPCVIEVESSRGDRMRLEVPSLETPGLVTLVREFVS